MTLQNNLQDGSNAYKIDFVSNITLYPIFNVANSVSFKGQASVEAADTRVQDDRVDSIVDLPIIIEPEMESILDSRVAKRMRQKDYMEHLVKWKDKPTSEATWMKEEQILHEGSDLQQLVSKRT